MSDGEGFLTRWSRRKREGAEDVAPRPAGPSPTDDALPSTAAARAEDSAIAGEAHNEGVGAPESPEFDPASLPPLESIGPESDITAFLARNVPAALKHAALRRVWASDPAIRDFVGLQENDWDFTNPDSIPGFGGALADHDVKEMVQRIFGEGAPADGPAELAQEHVAAFPNDAAKLQPVQVRDAPSSTGSAAEEQERDAQGDQCASAATSEDMIVQSTNDPAAQNHPAHRLGQYDKRPHRHGGALPREISELDRES